MAGTVRPHRIPDLLNLPRMCFVTVASTAFEPMVNDLPVAHAAVPSGGARLAATEPVPSEPSVEGVLLTQIRRIRTIGC